MKARSPGFTLIEVLAATLLTTGVVAGASALFIQLSDASTRSTQRTAESRHATAVLDRVARDLEGAYLVVKAAEGEASAPNPWIFLAEERRVGDGSDQLHFVVLNHVPRSNSGHSSDLAVVSYALESSAEGGYSLWRWVEPGLPRDPRREPPADETLGAVLADGIASFSTRFLSEDGDWRTSWDSTSATDADRLPLAAEVKVALLDTEAWEQDGEELAGEEYVRTVLLPVRPVDLSPKSDEGDGAGTGEDEADEDGLLGDDETERAGADEPAECEFGTVGQCMDRNAGLVPPDLDPALLNMNRNDCVPSASLTVAGFTIQCR
jgi:type II secretory pathway component PulJ